MMAMPIRAIYKQGQLQLLEPANLAEGQEVEVMILTEKDLFKEAFTDAESDKKASLEALKHLLVKPLPSDYDEIEIDEEAIMEEIREAFKGQPPLSEDIIRERQEGP